MAEKFFKGNSQEKTLLEINNLRKFLMMKYDKNCGLIIKKDLSEQYGLLIKLRCQNKRCNFEVKFLEQLDEEGTPQKSRVGQTLYSMKRCCGHDTFCKEDDIKEEDYQS